MWMTPAPTSNAVLVRVCLLLALVLGAGPAMADGLLTSLKGTPAPGALLIGKTLPGTKVLLGKKSLRVTSDGYFVFGFGRDAEGDRMLTLVKDGQQEQHDLSLQARQWHIQRVEGVPQETVTPPKSVLARIHREAALVARARQTDSSRRGFLMPFVWPASGPITGVYGSQRFYNGQPRNPHYGLDIAGGQGGEVIAPADGVVTLAYPDMFYSGGTLLVDHGYGISSTFIHLSKILVKKGDVVHQGDVIARIGSSGRATGPHLDWRINWYGERLDPQWFMSAMNVERVVAGRE